MDYRQKYLKYKAKYLDLKTLLGGNGKKPAASKGARKGASAGKDTDTGKRTPPQTYEDLDDVGKQFYDDNIQLYSNIFEKKNLLIHIASNIEKRDLFNSLIKVKGKYKIEEEDEETYTLKQIYDAIARVNSKDDLYNFLLTPGPSRDY